MALDIYKQAKRDGQNAAAMTAIKEIGILTGIRIERRESGAPGEFAEIENMTAEELEAFITGELETYRRGQSSQARPSIERPPNLTKPKGPWRARAVRAMLTCDWGGEPGDAPREALRRCTRQCEVSRTVISPLSG